MFNIPSGSYRQPKINKDQEKISALQALKNSDGDGRNKQEGKSSFSNEMDKQQAVEQDSGENSGSQTARKSVEELIYDKPNLVQIRSIKPHLLIEHFAVGKFDQKSFLTLFSGRFEYDILNALHTHHIVDRRDQLNEFPSFEKLKTILDNEIVLEDSGPSSPPKDKVIERLAFEILGFLIRNIPKDLTLGTINGIAIYTHFGKSTGKVILQKLISHHVIGPKGQIFCVPSMHDLELLLTGESSYPPSSVAKGTMERLLDGLGQYPEVVDAQQSSFKPTRSDA